VDRDRLQFGEFELDCARYELRKGGRALKLEKIPMDLLILLATSEGRLVTREEIEERLWGKGVFVDAEHGINTAVRKVRQALGDDPDKPKFIQTVQKKGYRFIAEVQKAGAARENAATELATTTEVRENGGAGQKKVGAKSKSGKRTWTWVAAAAMILLAWPAVKFLAPKMTSASRKAATIRSIAVLPLENISGDKEQEFFADGMTDELITMLAKYPTLRVISRTSVMQYKNAHRPLPEIARELGVDGIIEGSVSRGRGRVRVRAQLIYAPTDTHLWAESYDREMRDVLSLQDEIAKSVAEHVNVATSPPETMTTLMRKPVNLEARDAYYQGRSLWSVGQYAKSGDYFREAIRLEPNYAAAYAGLTDSYTALAVSGASRSGDVRDKAKEAVKKSLELDDNEAQAHHSFAGVKLFLEWDWEGAEKESERAIAINPGLAELHHLHAYVLEARNKLEESLKEDKLCVELDPFGRSWTYGFALYRARRYEDAIKEFDKRAEVGSVGPVQSDLLGLSYAHKGQYEKAIEEWKKLYDMLGQTDVTKEVERTYRNKGIAGVWELRLRLKKEQARKGYLPQFRLAEVAADAGHKAEALDYLEKAYQEREPLMVRVLHDPEFDVLHSDPRYLAIVKEMGLPGGE